MGCVVVYVIRMTRAKDEKNKNSEFPHLLSKLQERNNDIHMSPFHFISTDGSVWSNCLIVIKSIGSVGKLILVTSSASSSVICPNLLPLSVPSLLVLKTLLASICKDQIMCINKFKERKLPFLECLLSPLYTVSLCSRQG